MNHIHDINQTEQPWWSVRTGLLATLCVLIAILITLLIQPEMVDKSLLLAGL